MADAERFDAWAIVELMGHRRLAGRVTEQVIAGAAFLRLDVVTDCPDCGSGGRLADGAECGPCAGHGARTVATQFYSPGAVYAITPTTAAIAMDVAERDQPEPVARWELPQLRAGSGTTHDGERRCPGCGCTDENGCAEGCCWVDHTTLCSACADKLEAAGVNVSGLPF